MGNVKKPKSTLKVFFDGSCPLCSREIALYKKMERSQPICWVDVSGAAGKVVLPKGISHTSAMERFHVVDTDGNAFTGARAFAELWLNLKRFRYIGIGSKNRLVLPLIEAAYSGFLIFRPVLTRALSYIERNRKELKRSVAGFNNIVDFID